MHTRKNDHENDHAVINDGVREGAHDGAHDGAHEGEEIFLDQLKDAFIFFTAVTVGAMEAIAHARRHYQQRENFSPKAQPVRSDMHERGQA